MLEAFLRRHRMVAVALPQVYGDNDLELEQLTGPLREALKAVRREALARLVVPALEKRRKGFWRWGIAGLGLLLMGMGVWGWSQRSEKLQAIENFANASGAGGIAGSYYKGTSFAHFVARRADRQLNMIWPASPLHRVPADHYSVRWSGFLHAPKEGKYRFCLRFEDGARMWLGTRRLLSDWRPDKVRTRCGNIVLAKGWHTLQVELFELTKTAQIKLSWRIPGGKSMRAVPPKQLCCR